MSDGCSLPRAGTYYFSAVTGSMLANFYADTDGIRTAYVDMWRDIATAYRGRPEILGYDILNEPFPGNEIENSRVGNPETGGAGQGSASESKLSLTARLLLLTWPHAGNIYANPRLLLNASYADATLLQPLYDAAHDAIRTVDNEVASLPPSCPTRPLPLLTPHPAPPLTPFPS